MRLRTRIILSLLFGVLTTVAVAWACALWSESRETEKWDEESLADPPPWLPQAWVEKLRSRPIGRLATISCKRSEGFGVTDEFSTAYLPVEDVNVLAAEARNTSGWPFRAMWAAQNWDLPFGWSQTGCIIPPPWARPNLPLVLSPRVAEPPALPTRPIFLGFAADALLYAAVCASLSLIPAAARRRRNGRCPRCNYDRRGLPANAPCPECGQSPKCAAPAAT